ncbi:MAG: E2/UBC family protein [Chloroflexota bacterium]|nr:E2/UBC family protein [Chloroflexota bacterium]
MTTRLARVRAETFDLLAPEFGSERGRVAYDTEEGSWVCVRQLTIPAKLTPDGDGKVDILLLVPTTYPQIPPDGFYCDQALRLSGHYFIPMGFNSPSSVSNQLREAGWNWYCAHPEKRQEMAARWTPYIDHRAGDNLHKYLLLCLSILGSDAKQRPFA